MDPHQIVVGFDFSVSARAALERALAVAARAPWHVLQIVAVIEPRRAFPALPADRIDLAYAERVQHAITAIVREVLERARVTSRIRFSVHARFGRPAREILAVAREVGADLIMVGTHGLTGLERIVLGSVAERVVRDAGCTVEVVRDKTYPHVTLLDVVEVARAPDHYVPPHRYTYGDSRVAHRPGDWPLY